MNEPTPWRSLYRKRQAAGLTRADIAARTGYGVTYLGLLERGVKTNPSKPVIYALANALGCTPADLVDTGTAEDNASLTLEILAAHHAELGAALNALRAQVTAAAAA